MQGIVPCTEACGPRRPLLLSTSSWTLESDAHSGGRVPTQRQTPTLERQHLRHAAEKPSFRSHAAALGCGAERPRYLIQNCCGC